VNTADVVVVGAGPAGCAAAIALADAGREVIVVDRATFPRDKCCGDGLTTSALRHLDELGLDPATVASWYVVDDVVVRSPSGREISFPMPAGRGQFAAVARRRELDAALVDLARRRGAVVHEGHALRDATVHHDAIELDVEGLDPLRARLAIGADGMWSPLRKALGLATPGYRGEWHAFRQYFTGVGPRAARELVVWFEPDLLPGYAWSFPLADGTANVGYGIVRGGHHEVGDMKQQWPELLSRAHVREFLGPDAVAEGPHRAWPIPARVGNSALGGPRALFVGDAAAVTDPMTGEGIGQALETGLLAARAAIAHRDPTAAVDAYTRAVHTALAADHRMSRTLMRALAHRRSAEAALRIAGATDWTRRNFARWLFEDYPRAAVLTPRRWHREMFTGPGAFRPVDAEARAGA
jgi:geranylgeranyl reductase family protein